MSDPQRATAPQQAQTARERGLLLQIESLTEALDEAAHALVEVHGKGARWRNRVLNMAVRKVEREI